MNRSDLETSLGLRGASLDAALAEASPDGIVVVDRGGRIALANAEAERLFAYAPGELVGLPIEVLVPANRRDQHRQRRERFLADPTRRPMGTGLELSGQRKDGSTFPVDVGLGPLVTSGGEFVVAAVRDVTERREAEQALAYLAFVVESSEDALLSLDADQRIVTWNQSAARLFGYTAPEVLGQPLRTLFPPHRWQDESLVVEQVRAGDRVSRRPTEIQRKDGALVAVEVSTSALLSARGAVRQIAVLVRDVSEQRLAQDLLAASERRLAEAQELARVGLWAWDAATETVQLSIGFFNLLLLDPGSFEGSLADFIERFDPDHRDRFAAALERSGATGVELDVEARLLRTDGELRWFRLRGEAVLASDGRIHGVTGIAQDVTDTRRAEQVIRESEARYRSLFEVSPSAILIHEHGRITQANPEAARLLGALRPQDLVGRSVSIFLAAGGDGAGEAFPDLAAPAEPEDLGSSVEVDLVALDGRQLRVETRSSTVVFEGRRVWQTVLQDVTARHEAEVLLRRAYARERAAVEQLRDADLLKDEFLATVSHELRTPLTVILGFADMLDRQWSLSDESSRRDLIRRIGRNAEEMHEMVERLLDYSRLEAGRIHLRPAVLDLGETLRSVVDQHASLLARHRVNVDVAAGLQVWADVDAVRHILANVLSNSTKFAPVGSTILVAAEDGDEEVTVRVTDRGPGIPAELRPRIFERFVQGVELPAGRRGAGVGLAIVKRYVELLGGRIWIEDGDPPGTVIAFTLRRMLEGSDR